MPWWETVSSDHWSWRWKTPSLVFSTFFFLFRFLFFAFHLPVPTCYQSLVSFALGNPRTTVELLGRSLSLLFLSIAMWPASFWSFALLSAGSSTVLTNHLGRTCQWREGKVTIVYYCGVARFLSAKRWRPQQASETKVWMVVTVVFESCICLTQSVEFTWSSGSILCRAPVMSTNDSYLVSFLPCYDSSTFRLPHVHREQKHCDVGLEQQTA